MRTALLMDIDGTLTPARRRIRPEMVAALGRLTAPFNVAAGSHFALLEGQFFRPAWEAGLRSDFHAFLSNGATHYDCRFATAYDIHKRSEFDFAAHLGEADYAFLQEVLRETLANPDFALPEPLTVIGDTIVDRRSMLNLAPIGRPRGALSDAARANRDRFHAFDATSGYRLRVLDHLRERLARLRDEKSLVVLLGGQTSFDLVIEGMDKTNAARWLLANGFQRVVFFGDALAGEGNDSVMRELVERWDEDRPCPVTTVEVNGWRDTLQKLTALGYLPDGEGDDNDAR